MDSFLAFQPLLDHTVMVWTSSRSFVMWNLIKGFGCAVAASGVALLYSEILYTGTRMLYQCGKLQRYYPLPQERNLPIAFLNALAFIGPTALFAALFQPHLKRTSTFNPMSLLIHTTLYLLIHDVYFYLVHSTFHKLRPLYRFFHGFHHEYTYAMNVYMVGYAEMSENFIQVGIPWIIWTKIAAANWWNWLLPLSLIVFTTLVGHSGYRMHPYMALFHPLIVPFIAVSGRWMLTPGDHQIHHSHRRYNFGLFWRAMDQLHGTYRKNHTHAHDIHFWSEWLKNKEENYEEAKKWMNTQDVAFEEVQWGF